MMPSWVVSCSLVGSHCFWKDLYAEAADLVPAQTPAELVRHTSPCCPNLLCEVCLDPSLYLFPRVVCVVPSGLSPEPHLTEDFQDLPLY